MFDALAARGQIRLYPDAGTRREALAAIAAASYQANESVALVVDIREQAADLNAATRERRVGDGRVDDSWVVTTAAGQRIGAGDRVATRRNDRGLGVANRDTWIVTAVSRRGALVVTPADVTPDRLVTPGAGDRVLPPHYVTGQVELAYASTAHGVQGDTVSTAHVVIGEHTGAASAYVGMTRGRTANTAHLVAAGLDEGREQWIAMFARDRADLGPGHAAKLAAREAARYAQPRPLEAVLAELREAWTVEQRCLDRLTLTEPARDVLREIVALGPHPADRLEALRAEDRQTFLSSSHAQQQAEAAGAVVRADAARVRDGLLTAWDGQRDAAHQAAQVVSQGPGRFGRRRNTVTEAREQLADWANTWRSYLRSLPTAPDQITQFAGWFDDRPRLEAEFDTYARHTAEHAHPEHERLQSAAAAARTANEHARAALAEVRREQGDLVALFGRIAEIADPAARLADMDDAITVAHEELTVVRTRIAQLTGQSGVRAEPADRLVHEHEAWRTRGDADRIARRPVAPPPPAPKPAIRVAPPPPSSYRTPRPNAGPGIGR